MQLLVSVASAAEAMAAQAGGADVIDAKDPAAGALGAVRLDVFEAIRHAAAGFAPVTAALGEAPAAHAIEELAAAFAAAGAVFVKIGLANADGTRQAAERLALAVRGVTHAVSPGGPEGPALHRAPGGPTRHGGQAAAVTAGVIAVGFADAQDATVSLRALIDLAAEAGARGALLDTIDKTGPGLRASMSSRALARWVRHAHDAGLVAAVAGRIGPDDIAFVRDAGADIVGVRGAACDGGRTGTIVPEKVRLLRQLVRRDDEATAASGPPGRGHLRRTPACRPTS